MSLTPWEMNTLALKVSRFGAYLPFTTDTGAGRIC